jgi:hypothetical protein
MDGELDLNRSRGSWQRYLSGGQISELKIWATKRNKTCPFQCTFYTDNSHKQTDKPCDCVNGG